MPAPAPLDGPPPIPPPRRPAVPSSRLPAVPPLRRRGAGRRSPHATADGRQRVTFVTFVR